MAVVVKTNGVPFWLVGEFTTHFRTHFSWDWDVHWGYDLAFDPWPYGYTYCMYTSFLFRISLQRLEAKIDRYYQGHLAPSRGQVVDSAAYMSSEHPSETIQTQWPGE